MDNRLRRYTFRPYNKYGAPHFILTTWDANKRDHMGKNMLRYRLTMRYPRVSLGCGDGFKPASSVVLFEGADFACAPSHAIDSVAAAESLMGFLTLRPGDTDAEYFANYSKTQLDYCAEHAEWLAGEVSARWCDENGNLKARYSR